jgi:hypothetical protein
MSCFPITFSIPKEKIVLEIPDKKKFISNIIPGLKETYIYDDEKDYYNEYKQSIFARTCKKAGWDCLRHYEILANGCIPVFDDLENCPKNTLSLMPKDLLKESNELFNYLNKKSINQYLTNITKDDLEKCFLMIRKLLNYTNKNLTTESIAKYILEKTSNQNVKNILYLTQDLFPDYLRCLTLNGFKTLFETKCHDFPKIQHLYKNFNDEYIVYGKGFTYSKLLQDKFHDENKNNNIIEDIKSKKYDIIIYGSYHRGIPFYNELVYSIYEPNKIIFLCGEDIHDCYLKDEILKRNHYLFIRELE